MNTLKQLRQKSTLERLKAQLKSGVKPVKKNLTETIPLTDSDINRINKEIETLKKKGV